MRSSFLVCCWAALVLTCCQLPVRAQQEDGTRAGTLRRELVSTRRVGYLRRDRGLQQYTLLDNWDQQLYEITAADGLDLSPFVDRYVALRGDSGAGTELGTRRFRAQRVTALDGRQRGSDGNSGVQRAAFDEKEKASASPNKSGSQTARNQTARSQTVSQLNQPVPAPLPNPDPRSFPEVTPMLPPITVDPSLDGSADLGTSWPGLTDEDDGRPSKYWWARAEYLLWEMSSLDIPPLITASPIGTPQANAGVLGFPTTTVLFGGGVNDEWQAGFRSQLGVWLDTERIIGVEIDSVWFDDETTSFADRSIGDRILARPFFNAANGTDTAALVAYPGVVRGDISVLATSSAYTGSILAKLNHGGGIDREFAARGIRLDWLLGYRYMQLKDSVTVHENLVSLDPLNQGLFEISDSFQSSNEFHGVDIGIVQQSTRGAISLEWLLKVALGVNQQSVSIAGTSIIDEAGVVGQFAGGILALPSNIGKYERSQFAVVPELGGTLGWHVNDWFTVTLGYSLIYFSNVARAGDHISLDLNANQFPPPAMPLAGPLRPAFAFRETDFWAQGMSIGVDFRW